ncbi:MAG: rod shape-determining protein RodA [Candidatus Doudnabacteria bacterium RIFCSPHIGHO2_02_FULL_48_21]|uniref:Peptidoglycan glycosyltransferase RodA n=1 Tax=Candidatus Doudnabacteria bacterium RIFCSPLOWO2_02_FULL_48_13 TaxID=1817845 RepID=A0A1F5QB38_9BACT|nr:MAG: rod shape-determining protein RodA [Candidatus Doudnabacteria bacterium RIFCSPHIGHO2_01_48_18]OGE78444.1 MAG: rod shape-determining protein RodA [Candidatus Doudnabacteria bacterium RIFCSPHIGHO2_01_FULL_48_180]OGE91698.1 MAG: rod shape-determining protein RodA [Candidatus Doudnabacteria bacterium RIFCSPHIGHO2_12_FULL_47_25]OGE93435.1 MAG: rod shape-determining protein RodA [Candidatus Doudnabacteria bacterium RIFCSPHIGHO2_02_FULL_48_21]OGE97840.1 MAG: rod shape-determining protein RodA 
MIWQRYFRGFDWIFFTAALVLTAVGIMMIYSTGFAATVESSLWIRQLAALVIGLAGMFFFSSLDYRFLRKNSSLIYIGAILLLGLVLIMGLEIRGSKRWFELGPVNFQPAELSKLALIIILAKYFQVRQPFLQKFRYIILSFIYVLIPVVLIMLQPDLGSALVHLGIWAGMLLMAGIPRRFYLYLFLTFVLVSGGAWQFLLQDYQKDRILTFVDPAADPLGRGYNVIQSMVAVGSGGIFGRGLARGLQSQLRFLPERQTDFIFASTVEELGFFGGTLVLVFLGMVVFRILRIVKRSEDSFGAYLAAGAFFLLLTQIVINVAMNIGLLPVTGITLPFLSYGGSSLVATFWLVGLVESVAIHSTQVRFR